ncbi:MAG: HEPN domain-containing protein [Caldilineaceae bacterium]|uniref:HEPN domain-containing protein n=1 Tax=Caldilineaceae bacterium SB0675_bin_29 TaxID=2605266 RepID=A0A6B1G0S9_9CHLR|nr:HEPN domain-containing protein [Caldilineaceae bacterium]MYH61977.1 HEPN domain-containing protein [Caldilineaceae bacterium SB0675_bin_29]
MRRQTEAWLASARDDLRVVEEILDNEDLTHMVAFHCQQAVEKSFKAVLEEYDQIVPRTHDLITLRTLTEKQIRVTVEPDILIQMNDLYLDSRYPSDFGLLPGGKPPQDMAQQMYVSACKIHESIGKSFDQQTGNQNKED